MTKEALCGTIGALGPIPIQSLLRASAYLA